MPVVLNTEQVNPAKERNVYFFLKEVNARMLFHFSGCFLRSCFFCAKFLKLQMFFSKNQQSME